MACSKCKDGLIPFIKNGKVVPHAWVDCDCKQQIEHYQPLTPDMFDFPMSDTFRGFSYQYCNQPDPGETVPGPEAPPLQEIIHRHSDMSKQDYRLLRQLRSQVMRLQGQVQQHRTEPVKGTDGEKHNREDITDRLY